MSEESGMEKQARKWGLLAGGFLVLFLLHRWRQKRRVKKILKARARLKAREEIAEKEKRGKAAKRKKKGKKERSMVEQLVRFAVFQLLKRVISEQIKQMEIELGSRKLGQKLVEAAEKA